MNRKLVAALVVLALAHVPAHGADDYPSKPVTVIVPFPPAGVADLTGRPAAEALSRILKQPFVITNRPGAGGATGNAVVAAAKPDGYTLLVALASMAAIPEAERISGKAPSYRMDQFAPIAQMTADPPLMIARPESAWKSIEELVADAKRRPGKITYASSGIYGNIHIAVEMLAHSADVSFLHVPYAGGGPANTALISSQVDFTLAGLVSASPFIKSGKARPIAVWGSKRLAALPDVPALKELGHDVDYSIWCGIFAPAGVPESVQKRLRDAMQQVVADATFRETMEKMQTPIAYLDGPEFKAAVEADTKRFAETIRRIGRLEATK